MAIPLNQQCYDEGFQKHLRDLISVGMTKRAVNPLISTMSGMVTPASEAAVPVASAVARAVENPAELNYIRALGERTFSRATTHPNPFINMFNSWAAGYPGTQGVAEGRDVLARETSRLAAKLKSALSGSIKHDELTQNLNDLVAAHQGAEGQAFEDIGRTAGPRLKFMKRDLPIGAGVAAAGAGGYQYGRRSGVQQAEQMDDDSISNAPLMDRMRYLLRPSRGPGMMRNYRQPSPDEMLEKESRVKQSGIASTILPQLGRGVYELGRFFKGTGRLTGGFLKSPAQLGSEVNRASLASSNKVSLGSIASNARTAMRNASGYFRSGVVPKEQGITAYVPEAYKSVMQPQLTLPRGTTGGAINRGFGHAVNYGLGTGVAVGSGAIGAGSLAPETFQRGADWAYNRWGNPNNLSADIFQH